MNTKNPRISVVIPTLNEEKYLPRCLESFKHQTFQNFEIIISDGGSSDNTAKIANLYKAKVIINKNSTITIARQSGAEEAKGEIITGADADTFYPPDHLEKIIYDFTKYPNIVAVGGGGIFEKYPWWAYWGWKIAYNFFSKLFTLFHFVMYIPAFNLSYKKDIFMKIGGYNTYLDFGGDEIDILQRLKKAGNVFFDSSLSAYPSSRRASLGFWQLIIQHTLIDYYLNYFLAKIFRRTIIRGKPIR